MLMERDKINSLDQLLKPEVWNGLSDAERTELYFKLQEQEDPYDYDDRFSIIEYEERQRRKLDAMRTDFSSSTTDCNAQLFGVPDGSVCRVAVEGGKVAGYILFEDELGMRQVREIFVKPGYRRQGVMTRLFSSVEGDLPLGLLVLKSNRGAQEAFRKYGFVNEGSQSSHYYLMTKQF